MLLGKGMPRPGAPGLCHRCTGAEEPRRRAPRSLQRAKHGANHRTMAGGLPGGISANSVKRHRLCPHSWLPGRGCFATHDGTRAGVEHSQRASTEQTEYAKPRSMPFSRLAPLGSWSLLQGAAAPCLSAGTYRSFKFPQTLRSHKQMCQPAASCRYPRRPLALPLLSHSAIGPWLRHLARASCVEAAWGW